MLDAQPLRKAVEMIGHNKMDSNFRITFMIPLSIIYFYTNSRKSLQENEILLINKMGIRFREEKRYIPKVILHTAKPVDNRYSHSQFLNQTLLMSPVLSHQAPNL